MSQKKPDTSSIFLEKQEVFSSYLSIRCKQIDALLATRRVALISDFFCKMRSWFAILTHGSSSAQPLVPRPQSMVLPETSGI